MKLSFITASQLTSCDITKEHIRKCTLVSNFIQRQL